MKKKQIGLGGNLRIKQLEEDFENGGNLNQLEEGLKLGGNSV